MTHSPVTVFLPVLAAGCAHLPSSELPRTTRRNAVEAEVVGEPGRNPLYGMALAARSLTDSVSLVVVLPPAEAASVRLILVERPRSRTPAGSWPWQARGPT